MLRVNTRLPSLAAISEGALTAIDSLCKLAAWLKILDDEAKALSFQKTWTQDIRKWMGASLFAGSLATGVGNVAKMYGTWRNMYAMGIVEGYHGDRLVQAASKSLRYLGAVAGALAGVAAAMDLVDGVESSQSGQFFLMKLQMFSGGTGIAAAIVAVRLALVAQTATTTVLGVEVSLLFYLNIWATVLALLGVAVALLVNKVQGDNVAQLLERCYWGNHPSYDNAGQEQMDFQKQIAQA